MKKVLIFPAPFLIKKPTADQQNDYLFSLLRDEMATEGIGDFIEVNTLNGLHGIKKLLVNPIVTFDDLNNVSEYARQHTYGFFGALPQQQKSYELFQSVYPNAAWYVNAPNLSLIDIKDISVCIISDKSNE